MSEGSGVVVEVSTAGALADLINSSASHNALALGVLKGVEPDRNVSIAARSRVRNNPNALTRTLEHMAFEPGRPAWNLLDFDQKGMPAEVKARLEATGAFEAAIAKVLEKLPTVAHVIRPSTSSGLRNTTTGELYPGSGGLHLYVLVQDGADIPRFLDVLFKRLWLEGLGWIAISKAGSLLVRGIVDAAVGSPERLVFEGPPTLGPGLEQDATLRAAVATEGEALNSRTCMDLSEAEEAGFRSLVEAAKTAKTKEAEAAKAAWIEERIPPIAAKTGKPVATIRAELERSSAGCLCSDFVLYFDNLGEATVGEVLADPERFINETLSDPHEPEDQGRNCAVLYRGKRDGGLIIFSHAHGGLTYQLEHKFPPKAEPSAADQEAIEALKAGNVDAFVEAAKKDTSLPFLDEPISFLSRLMGADPRAFEQLRARLKSAGVRIGALSGRIEEAAKRDREPSTGAGGQPIEFETIEPWPDPVDGAELLTEISSALRRYMVMSAAHSDATALWTIHTWSHDFRDTSPLLIITSPVPGCAKTRLLDTVSRVVLRPLSPSGISGASLVNVIDKHRPTLMVDEYDALMNGDREAAQAIRGAVDAAHKRSGAFLIKNVPTADGWDPRAFSVWAPIALAGIDKPQRTLIERGIIITLQKKLRKDVIARLRLKDGGDLRELARKVVRWVADNEARLREWEPAMPEALSDRDCDKWDPLIAIADVAGNVDRAGSVDIEEDEWPARARRVAVELAKADAEDVSVRDVKQLLLADIHDIFAELYPSTSTKAFPDGHPAYRIGRGPRVSTERLLRELHQREERDWGAFGRARKPLTDVGLSRLLNGYGIRPNRVRVNDAGTLFVPEPDLLSTVSEEALGEANKNVRRGYYLSSFTESFERYL
jgi:hypothetical protein